MNSNVHFHTLFADGVFQKTADGYTFFRLPPPPHEELYFLAAKIQAKVLRVIDKLGLNESDQMGFDENSLQEMAAMSIRHRAAFGERAGGSLRRYGVKNREVDLAPSVLTPKGFRRANPSQLQLQLDSLFGKSGLLLPFFNRPVDATEERMWSKGSLPR